LGYRIWNHKSTHFIPQIQAQQVAKGWGVAAWVVSHDK
jgi:hypothetical protein